MRDPDLQGPCGKAWLLRLSNARPDQAAGIASWLVNRPGAHPLWQWWLVGVTHLRDLPGVKPAFKKYSDAEYEFIIYSIDPESCPSPTPDDPKGYPMLKPVDVIEQFHGITDKDASRLCESAIRVIVNGNLSPDQDFRSVWSRMVAGTVQHLAEGAHPLN